MPQIQWQPSLFASGLLVMGMLLGLLILLRGTQDDNSISGKLILLLRLAMIALLVIAGYMPTLIQIVPAAASRQVVLVIDDSKSMSVNDSNYSLSEIIHFGRATGAIESSAAVSLAEPLLEPVNQVISILENEKNQKPDATSINQIQQQCASIHQTIGGSSSLSGYRALVVDLEDQIARQTGTMELLKQSRQLREQIRVQLDRDYADALDNDEDLRAAVDLLTSLNRMSLAQRAAGAIYNTLGREMEVVLHDLQRPIRFSEVLTLTPADAESSLLKLLRSHVERTSSQRPDGIILLTDGRSTEMRSTIPSGLIASGVPVYPVLAVPSSDQPDVRVVSIDTPNLAMAGETIDIIVRVRSRYAESVSAVVRMGDRRSYTTRTITLGNADSMVRFEYKVPDSGPVQLEASVDSLAAESHTENNFAVRSLHVLPEKMIVSIMHDGKSEEINSILQIIRQVEWISAVENRIDPRSEIVMINSPSQLDAQQVSQLGSLVLEKGKSLLLVECDAKQLSSLLMQSAWQKLIPLGAVTREPFKEISQDVLPNTSQFILGINRLDWHANAAAPDFADRLKLQQKLDLSAMIKSGFAVLNDQQNKIPLIAGLSARSGRVVISGVTGTRRWADADASRFWMKLLRGLIDWPMKIDSPAMQLVADQPEITQGDPIYLSAFTSSPAAGSVQLLQKLSDQSVEPQTMVEGFPGSGRWYARAVPRLPGECIFTFHQGSAEVSRKIEVKTDPDLEMRDVVPDAPLMRRVASATGGEVFSLGQIDQISKSINRRISTQTRRIERNIWCSQYFYLLIAGLLGFEWSVRKLTGRV